MKNDKKKNGFRFEERFFSVLIFSFLVLIGLLYFVSADPVGPNSIAISSNETSVAPGAATLNISGGRIATINVTANTQNSRWKAFVGNVSGSFTLDDASGSTIYDWSLTSLSGEIYATRFSGSITWANVNCSNITWMEQENVNMNHTNSQDNLSATFVAGTHTSFVLAGNNLVANSCRTLNTYVNNATQDTDFEEVVLFETIKNNTIFTTILENEVTGFDSNSYDFQMIVPEIGLETFTGSTAYYLYVEIT